MTWWIVRKNLQTRIRVKDGWARLTLFTLSFSEVSAEPAASEPNPIVEADAAASNLEDPAKPKPESSASTGTISAFWFCAGLLLMSI